MKLLSYLESRKNVGQAVCPGARVFFWKVGRVGSQWKEDEDDAFCDFQGGFFRHGHLFVFICLFKRTMTKVTNLSQFAWDSPSFSTESFVPWEPSRSCVH